MRLGKNIYRKKEDQIYLKQTGDHIAIDKWLEEFLDDKGAFYNGSESEDSDNDDESYNENKEQQQLSE